MTANLWAEWIYHGIMKKRIRPDFPEFLYNERKKRGMSQQNLADALGCSRTVIAQWESGDRSPSREHMTQISKLFGLKMEMLENQMETAAEDEPIYIDLSVFPMSIRKIPWKLDGVVRDQVRISKK